MSIFPVTVGIFDSLVKSPEKDCRCHHRSARATMSGVATSSSPGKASGAIARRGGGAHHHTPILEGESVVFVEQGKVKSNGV